MTCIVESVMLRARAGDLETYLAAREAADWDDHREPGACLRSGVVMLKVSTVAELEIG